MFSWVVGIWEWFWHLLESSVERIEIWFITRRWEFMPAGLPALLAAGTLAFIVIGQRSKPAVAVAEPYRQAFRAAIDAQDFSRAELFFRKLRALNVADDATRFQFATLAATDGKPDVAFEHIRSLAPLENAGYPPAHLWLARLELQRNASWTAEDRQRCIHHLQVAKSDPTLRDRASEVLGLLQLISRDYPAAVEELKAIPEPSINARVALATAHRLSGRPEDSKTTWSGVVSAAERQLASEPDDTNLRLLLAIANSQVDQFEKATQVLREGLERPSGTLDQRLREALKLADAKQLNSATPSGKTVDRQKLLNDLIESTPTSVTVALRLMRWPILSAEESQRIRDEVKRRAEAGGPGAAAFSTVQGTADALSGDLVEARKNLERANSQQPNNPGIMNNLAWVLANSQPPELERALELANAAAKIDSENAQIRETRGQIFLQLKRWPEAVEDLTFALPKLQGDAAKRARKGIAEAKEMMGNE